MASPRSSGSEQLRNLRGKTTQHPRPRDLVSSQPLHQKSNLRKELSEGGNPNSNPSKEKFTVDLEEMATLSILHGMGRGERSNEPKQLKALVSQKGKDAEEMTVEGKSGMPSVDQLEKKKKNLIPSGETGKPLLIKDNEVISKKTDEAATVAGASSGQRNLRWNLRDRTSLQLSKAVNVNHLVAGSSSQAVREKDKAVQRNGKGKKDGSREDDLPPLPKFSVGLKFEEISEDIFALTGKLPSRKANKRSKKVTKWAEILFPGAALEKRTINQYKVSPGGRRGQKSKDMDASFYCFEKLWQPTRTN